MIILFSLGDERHCFFCSAAVGSSPPSDAENNSLFVLKVNDFVCVCVLLLGACSLSFCFGGGAHLLSLSLFCFDDGMIRSFSFCLSDGRLCVCRYLAAVLSLFVLVVGHILFSVFMMMELYDHSLFCLGDGRLCVCCCLAAVLSLCFSGGTRSTSL